MSTIARLGHGWLAVTLTLAAGGSSAWSAEGGAVMATIENELARLEVDEGGCGSALVDKQSGRNLLASVLPLASLTVGGKVLVVRTCSYADGKLRFGFGTGSPVLTVEVTAKPRYFTFEVLAVEGDGVERVTYLSLPLIRGKLSSYTSGATVGDDWAVCVRALNLQTEFGSGGSPTVVRAGCTNAYGLVGARAGLVVAPPEQVRSALKELVKAEGVPQSDLGGPWALDAEANRGSYLFAHPSEKDAERWIEFGRRGGFACLHYDGWYKTLGHYEPAPGLFPSGLEGVKDMVRKVHAAGMRAGMHTLTGCIQPRDSWVTPVPDPRLAADASYALAADLDETADTVLTVERPREHDIIWSYSGNGNALRLGEEIVQYAEISFEPPYGFRKCTRGAFGTKPSAHRQGIAVDHLRQVYLAFYPDEKSTLVGEVADAIAHVYNGCEFDQIYMDGAEGMGSWHAAQVMRDAIYRRLRRPVTVEASEWGHWSWYYHSRIGAWDHATWGWKRFVDMHCADIASYRQGALLQAQLGWWVVLGAGPGNRAETPDEMEYFCGKNLGYDAPSSTQVPGSLAAPANARLLEYVTMAGWYERLRLANYFPAAVREQLRQPGHDFHLVRAASGDWQLLPTDYHGHKITGLGDGSDVWTVTNRFGRQPAGLRLEALYAVEPYDSADSVLIADFANPEAFAVTRTATGVTQSRRRSSDQVRVGEGSLCYTATSALTDNSGWSARGRRYREALDLTRFAGIGFWLHGDGKGEAFKLQLRDQAGGWFDMVTRVDFRGWRYVQFDFGGVEKLDLARVEYLLIYYNAIPAGQTVSCCVDAVRALPALEGLRDPELAVGTARLVFPVSLAAGDRLVYDGTGSGQLHRRGRRTAETVDPRGGPLRFGPGPNPVQLALAPGSAPEFRATVSLVKHYE